MIPLEWMPALMFAGLVVFLIIGFPVAFSLASVGLFFGMISMAQGFFTIDFMQSIPGRIKITTAGESQENRSKRSMRAA